MTQTIRFSHKYFKMPLDVENRKTYLLGVQKIHFSELPEGLITYDTMYEENGKIKHYPLPKTELIILTLFTEHEKSPMIWTTIRSNAPRKFNYYSKFVGKEVGVKIE